MVASLLAIDIGGTSVKYGLVDTAGKIVTKNKITTPRSLPELITWLKQEAERRRDDITGIAVSSPGSVSSHGKIYGGSAIPYIHGPNIREEIEEATDFPVTIENDANCAALAEVWQGAAKGKQNVAVIVLGTGVGGALIHEGAIHKGNSLHAGEFGYMILNAHNFGNGMNTFSEVASTNSIVKRVAAKKGISQDSITGEQVFQMASTGDMIAKEAIAAFQQMLAIGIFNIQYAYDPEVILLGGGISQREDVIPAVEEWLHEIVETIDVATVVPKIKPCYFQSDANLLGAVQHFLQQKRF